MAEGSKILHESTQICTIDHMHALKKPKLSINYLLPSLEVHLSDNMIPNVNEIVQVYTNLMTTVAAKNAENDEDTIDESDLT
eukprot:UN15005